MKKKDINLAAMHEFLTSDVYLDQLINHLDSLYYTYTNMAMHLSGLDNEPIYEEKQNGRYWIERLKEVFEEIQAQNTKSNEH